MDRAVTITRDEYLEIDANPGGVANMIPLATYAWEILDLSPLWSSAKKRGSDRLVPGVAGVRSYRRRRTVTVRSLPMIVYGDLDQNGAAYADAREGLETNIAYLEANLVEDPGTTAGTRNAILHRPLSTKSGAVHVLGLELAPLGPSSVRAVLELSIPAGKLL